MMFAHGRGGRVFLVRNRTCFVAASAIWANVSVLKLVHRIKEKGYSLEFRWCIELACLLSAGNLYLEYKNPVVSFE